MPTQTFLKLKPPKKDRIQHALLDEFSHYPLMRAQVSRIILSAQISRGAFYSYFHNLDDAYQYLLSSILQNVHLNLLEGNYHYPQYVIDNMHHFLQWSLENHYVELFKMHFKYNEAYLNQEPPTRNLSARAWAFSVLSHKTLCNIFTDCSNQDFYLHRFQVAIHNFKED